MAAEAAARPFLLQPGNEANSSVDVGTNC